MHVLNLKPTKVIQTRLDADLIDQANKILDEIGLTTSDIFRVLLKKVVSTGEVPLTLTINKPYFNDSQAKQIDNSLTSIDDGEEMPSLKPGDNVTGFLSNL